MKIAGGGGREKSFPCRRRDRRVNLEIVQPFWVFSTPTTSSKKFEIEVDKCLSSLCRQKSLQPKKSCDILFVGYEHLSREILLGKKLASWLLFLEKNIFTAYFSVFLEVCFPVLSCM